jgi:DUF2934 family protein
MSRAISTATPTMQPQAMNSPTPAIPHERIAKRAYEKWLKTGCKHGCDKQNWLEAEAEIRTEMSKGGMSGTPSRR